MTQDFATLLITCYGCMEQCRGGRGLTSSLYIMSVVCAVVRPSQICELSPLSFQQTLIDFSQKQATEHRERIKGKAGSCSWSFGCGM